MTILSKAIIVILAFSTFVGLLALLPDASDYPLPPEAAAALQVILGNVFAWSSVFSVINTLWALVLLTFGFELAVWTWKVVQWVIGIMARFVG